MDYNIESVSSYDLNQIFRIFFALEKPLYPITIKKNMKKIITKPFDRDKIPPRQAWWGMPVVWIWSLIATFGTHLKIHKENTKGLKPPFILLGSHHAFNDFCVTPLAIFPHRANYVSELEGFKNYGEWPYDRR